MIDLLRSQRQGEEPVRARFLQSGGGRIGRKEVRRRAGAAMSRGLPTFKDCSNTSSTWAIIGGGPSINDNVAAIRAVKRCGAAVVSVNKSHDWLLAQGIVPCAKRLLMDGILEEETHG